MARLLYFRPKISVMISLDRLFNRIETSSIATTIGQSTLLTGSLSGIHLIGMTLVVGGALVSSLRLLGLAMSRQPVSEVADAPRRGTQLGLAISLATGLLLVAPRISMASASRVFQAKMILLLSATVFHFTIFRKAVVEGQRRPKLVGVVGLALWVGVLLAGCAFILLE